MGAARVRFILARAERSRALLSERTTAVFSPRAQGALGAAGDPQGHPASRRYVVYLLRAMLVSHTSSTWWVPGVARAGLARAGEERSTGGRMNGKRFAIMGAG